MIELSPHIADKASNRRGFMTSRNITTIHNVKRTDKIINKHFQTIVLEWDTLYSQIEKRGVGIFCALLEASNHNSHFVRYVEPRNALVPITVSGHSYH